jgi:hypothetical protein
MSDTVPRPDQSIYDYKRLADSSQQLNAASDELRQSIELLDAGLAKLNIGIAAWVKFGEAHDPEADIHWAHRVGYSKVSGRWGITIDVVDTADPSDSEEWLFNDAPRALRVAAAGHLPELLGRLAQEADGVAARMKAAATQAQSLVVAVSEQAPATRNRKQEAGR